MKKLFIAILLFTIVYEVKAQHSHEVSKNLQIFNSAYCALDEYYVDTLNPAKQVENALRSIVYDFDPYTEFYTPEKNEELQTMTTGKYAGIGALIHYYDKEKRCIIDELYENMPADKYGLMSGDILMSIDGKDLGIAQKDKYAEYTSGVSAQLRGDAGSVVKIKVKRSGVDSLLMFDVIRENIQLPSVPYYGMLQDGIGYIYLNSFTLGCSEVVLEAIKSLKADGCTSLILDLRGNGGGLANEAVNIVNFFVPKGKLILQMKGKHPSSNASYATKNKPIDTKIPLVVLVDNGSASASEITCGSLQDLDRAVIVGRRTFGKGLVQQVHPLPYNTAIKMTVSHYYIPSGRCIQALDYSKKKDDGEIYRTPDSLTHEYRTQKGRVVRDGGGITPDVEVKIDTLSKAATYIKSTDTYFDYITWYRSKHSIIAPATEFCITDDDFDEFKQFISKQSNDYKLSSAKKQLFENLREVTKLEGSDTPETMALLDTLQQSMKVNLSLVMEHERKVMKSLISSDIVQRYYYQRGAIQNQIRKDNNVKEAIKILTNEKRYKSLLKP